MIGRALLLATALAALLAPAADAATLTHREQNCYEGSHFCATTTLYRADPGERNDLTVTRDAAGTTVRDAVAAIRPGTRCTAIDAHAARCPALDVELALGDGDDRAAVSGLGHLRLDGGAGNDTIAGSAGNDELIGGPGRDVIDGGAGVDQMSYWEEPAVHVDLGDPGPDGPAGDEDTLAGIEHVLGSAGADVLVGDAGPNRLEGGPGDDVLFGGDGNDRLDGGAGRDRLHGDDGDDQLAPDAENASAPGPGGEGVSCGAGTDRVTEQAHDILKDCERLELPLGILAPRFDPRPTIGRRFSVLRLRCSVELRAGPRPGCRVRVTLSAGGRRLGERTAAFTGRGHAIRVPFGLPDGGALTAVRVTLRYLGRAGRDPDRATTIYIARLD